MVGPVSARAHHNQHARPGLLGLLHRQLYLPRRRCRGGGDARHPGLHLQLEAHQGDRHLRRAPRCERHRHVHAFCLRRRRSSGPRVAAHAHHRHPQPTELAPGLGRHGPQRLSRAQPHHRPPPALHRLPPTAVQPELRRPAAAVLDPCSGRHPHRHRLCLRRHRRPSVLELGHPRAALPRLGLLLRSGHPAHPLPDPPADHQHQDQGRGDLEDRRAHGLRHVPQPLSLRRRDLPRVLLQHSPPHPHPVPLQRCPRPRCAGALRLGLAHLQRRRVSPVSDPSDEEEPRHPQPRLRV